MVRKKSSPGKLKNSESPNTKCTDSSDYKTSGTVQSNSEVVSSHNVEKAKDVHQQFYLGDISLGLTESDIPQTWTKCKISFLSSGKEILLKFDLNPPISIKTASDIFCKYLFKCTGNVFVFNFKKGEHKVLCDIFIKELPLTKFNSYVGNIIKAVFCIIFKIKIEKAEPVKNKKAGAIEVQRFYNNLQELQRNLTLPHECIEHPYLKPVLKNYQKNSVRWMISCEKRKPEEMMNPLYQEVLLQSGVIIYFDRYTGHIENTKPLVDSLKTGGILADEMGLGKTVEVLSCILCNPCPMKDVNAPNTIEDEGKTPTIISQSRKRTVPRDYSNDLYVDSSKKLKLKIDFKSKRKHMAYTAAEAWYKNTLLSMATSTGRRAKTDTNVICICGSSSKKKIVICSDCSKCQHSDCFGYDGDLKEYKCPQCWMNQPLIDVKATLIVAPKPLINQWRDEILKHLRGNVKVLIYEGATYKPIYPTKLAEYDIVLTNYSVLQSELRFDESLLVNLRTQRRYCPQGSSLGRVRWWRLCLDEAQMVEIPSHMVSSMAQKLEAVHRWAVTGTPISRNIGDLYGLIDYLQLEPYCYQDVWNYAFHLPYTRGNEKPMLDFLAKVMWRTQKQDVLDQIGVPKQTTNQYTIEFSAIEKFYYRREHELCASKFLHILTNYDLNLLLKSLDRSSFKKLLTPLLAIRQACSHPNVTRGRYISSRKQVTTMEDLSKALVEKNKSDCEELLRATIASINGLAGIYLLLQSPESAVEQYRKVLQIVKRFRALEENPQLTADKLQVIHTLHNLAEVLKTATGIPPTLEDDNIQNRLATLQTKYMDKYIQETFSALTESTTATQQVNIHREKLILNEGQWFSDLLDWVSLNDLMPELHSRISTSLENAYHRLNIGTERNLLYLLGTWNEHIIDYRTEFLELLDEVYVWLPEEDCKIIIKEEIVQAATDCHLRPQKGNKRKCQICVINSHMKKYEAILFDTKTVGDGVSNTGSWKPTASEVILKSLWSFAKLKKPDVNIVKDGQVHLRIIEAMRKEFKELRKFWTFLDQQVCAQDEIDICKTRLRLKDSTNEECRKKKINQVLKQLSTTLENKLENINLIEEHELDYQRSILMNEEVKNMAELEKLLGTQKYLETLSKKQNSGNTPDLCPICNNILQEQWSILPCGHSYCLECIQSLLDRIVGRKISCSICRQPHSIEDISYICTRQQEPDIMNDSIKIKGNFSSKIEAVTKLILQLRSEDEDVKVLVFSNWPEILKVLRSAFIQNEINCEMALSQNAIKPALNKFKDPKIRNSALLLPITLGSKGLNLIEATHVILAEPLINPAEEEQAIGRIHRIGQTKSTFVHKFIIKNTIEDNIHQAVSSNAEIWDVNKVTLKQLKDLFF